MNIAQKPHKVTSFGNNLLGQCYVGKIVSLDGEGRVFVSFDEGEPLLALILQGVLPLSGDLCGQLVLLTFISAEIEQPVILGLLASSINAKSVKEKELTNTCLNKEFVSIEAEREIKLTCGKSSITLGNDGKVLIKGTKITSRSSGVNKIKGASISLN